ncbi:MAG: SCP2 sterol-binding domain-containing protein [Pedobacter sp.]|nr:SCP2 sterol-binding domain-containing protein [Pedobacter sp.]
MTTMMSAYDNYGDNPAHERPLAQYLWLGAIETLINAFVDLDAPTRARVLSLDGLVVRVKVMDPYLPFYLYFTAEGIEVSEVAPAPAHVRVNARLFDLMRTLLGTTPVSASGRPRVRVWGDAESVAELEALLTDFNLRTRAQHWLREHLNMDVLWQKIRNHDPSWLQDFLPLPGLMRETLNELKQLNQNLRAQQEEFERYRQSTRQQRSQDMVFLLLAFVALAGGLGGGLSAEALSQLDGERILLLVMGLVLILSRLRQ